MAIKDLAVAYNGSDNADRALRFALQMGEKYGAEVTALHVHAPLQLESTVARWTSKSVLENLREADRAVLEGVEKTFKQRIADAGAKSTVDWEVETGPTNEHLARMARCHDLLLIGQSSRPGEKRPHVRAEDLVVRMGRPLLVIPADYELRPFSEHAVLAWDGSRPASRAVSDAMQILETKNRIDVVTVGPKSRTDEADSGHSPIISHLRRHDVDAQRVYLEAGKGGVGAAILDHCAAVQPDVLVMGAYGHARLREDLFGGVTNQILASMNVPVLLSH